MPTHAHSRTAAHAPVQAKPTAAVAGGPHSNGELAAEVSASDVEGGGESSFWDGVAAELQLASGAAAPPTDAEGATGASAGGGRPASGSGKAAKKAAKKAAEEKKKKEIEKKKHELGGPRPEDYDPASVGDFGTQYGKAFKDWMANRAAHRAAQSAEQAKRDELAICSTQLQRAAEDVLVAQRKLREARGRTERDDRAAQAEVDKAQAAFTRAKEGESAAQASFDDASARRAEIASRTTEAKTRVLQQAAKIDLPQFQDDEREARGRLAAAAALRERAQRDLENTETIRDDTASVGTRRVEDAQTTLDDDTRRVTQATQRVDSATQDLSDAEEDTKKKSRDAKNPWLDPTRTETKRETSSTGDKEVSFSGGRFGGRDHLRASATLERNKREFDRDLKTSYGSGDAITTRKGFQGDIPDALKVRASGLEAGEGKGADGVFFESTRGKGETGYNAQAFLADAGASAGAKAQGGDWAKGDTLGVHAQAKARAAAAGTSASANAAANGGPKVGAIDPITGERKGMLNAEAGIDADVRLLEVGAATDAQASVQGTRAQASIDASADATIARATGGVNGDAGVEVGGFKLAGAKGGASGTMAATARGSASAGAEVGLSGVKAKVAGDVAAALEAEGELHGQATLLGIDAKAGAQGRAMAGAEASGELAGGLNLAKGDAFAKAEGEAFVGAKAEGSVEGGIGLGDMDLLTMSLHGTVQAGAGISGKFLAGMVDGAFEMFAQASAAVGVGAGGGMGLNVGVFVPVKYALQLLNDNGVVSNDPDDWIPQMVELGKTGKVLRSQQQGIDGFGEADTGAPSAAPTPSAPSAQPDTSQGGPAGGLGADLSKPSFRDPASTSAVRPAATGVGAAGDLSAGLAAPDLTAMPPEHEPSRHYAEPRGEAASVGGHLDDPMSIAGAEMFSRPEAFDLEEVEDLASGEDDFGGLTREIGKARDALSTEMAPLEDLEGRWLEGFNTEAASLVDTVTKPIQKLWGLIDTAIGGIAALLSGDLGGVVKAGQDLIEGAGEIITGAWALLEQAFTDPIGAINSFFAKFDGLRAGAEAIFGGLLSGMSSMTAFFEGEIGPARALSGMIRGMAEGVIDVLVDHGHDAAEDVRSVGDKADEVLENPVDRDALPGVELELDDEARSAIDEDAERIEEIGGEASVQVLKAIDQAADNVDGYIEDAVSFATGLVTDAVDGARRVFDDIKNAVVGAVTGAQGNLLVEAARMIAERIAAAARAIAAFFGWI